MLACELAFDDGVLGGPWRRPAALFALAALLRVVRLAFVVALRVRFALVESDPARLRYGRGIILDWGRLLRLNLFLGSKFFLHLLLQCQLLPRSIQSGCG